MPAGERFACTAWVSACNSLAGPLCRYCGVVSCQLDYGHSGDHAVTLTTTLSGQDGKNMTATIDLRWRNKRHAP
jgi:hypothetical protein